MAMKLSKALRNFVLEGGSLKNAMSNCFIKFYTGAQPSTAEAAPTGTLLVTFSDTAGTPTRETLATGSVALTGGASGSVNTLTVNSIEIMGSATSFNTSLTQTAADICDKINNNPKNLLYTAANNSSATITITAKPGLGATVNTHVVASTVTTITKTDTSMSGGVTAVNGLNWGDAAAGILVKLSTQTWSGTPGNTGTAGWFRIEASTADAGALDSIEAVMRIDGSIASTGAEFNMGNLTITSGVLQRVQDFSITLPTA